MSRNDARKECDPLLDLWQIQELRHKPSSRLSGGQRRLLRLAVAMAGSPPVLMLDEPTNDLDPQRRKLVWDNLRRINQEQGKIPYMKRRPPMLLLPNKNPLT